MSEDYPNAKNFCDGDIYRQIRKCDAQQDALGRGKWLVRLSECKRIDLLKLLKKEHLQPIVLALDKLIPFVGLWPTLQLGTLHRLLSLKCPEVRVRDAWLPWPTNYRNLNIISIISWPVGKVFWNRIEENRPGCWRISRLSNVFKCVRRTRAPRIAGSLRTLWIGEYCSQLSKTRR